MTDLGDRRVLVTGADGLVGHAIAHDLARRGARVISIGRGGDLPGGRALDLSSEEWPAEGCDAIVHCAARLPARFEGPEAEAADAENRQMDERALAAAAEHEAQLVYFSSGSVYGPSDGVIDESTPVRPTLGYARQKLETEERIDAADIPATVFRLVAPYGPRQRRRTVLKMFLESALSGEPLTYYGTGSRTQDFIHVDDVALAVSQAVAGQSQGLFVLASGQSVAMRELAELVVRSTNSESSVVAAGHPDPEESRRVRYSVDRLRAQLNLPPARLLEDGLRDWATLYGQATA